MGGREVVKDEGRRGQDDGWEGGRIERPEGSRRKG